MRVPTAIHFYLRVRTGNDISTKTRGHAGPGCFRGAADRGEHRQAAGAIAVAL